MLAAILLMMCASTCCAGSFTAQGGVLYQSSSGPYARDITGDPQTVLNCMILLGQSNATGNPQGISEILPKGDIYGDIPFWCAITKTSDLVTDIQLQGNLGPMATNYWGCEMSAAPLLQSLQGRWAVFKYGYDGAGLSTEATNHSATTWAADGGQNWSVFTNAFAGRQVIHNNIQAAKLTPACIVWMQGPHDALQPYGTNYLTNLEALIDESRSVYGADLPWIVERLGTGANISNRAYYAYVRAAQEDIVGTRSNVVYIDTDDLTDTDGAHYDGASLITFGERVYEAYTNNWSN